MQYRNIGNSAIRVSRLSYGCSRIASLNTRYPRSEVIVTLERAFDLGITLFDTADIYGQGDSERMLGKVFGNRRKDVVLSTKAGLTIGPYQVIIRQVKPILQPILRRWRGARQRTTSLRQKSQASCYDPAYIKGCFEASLTRLRTEWIDIFMLHNPPTSIENVEELINLMQSLQGQSKIRCYGVSCEYLQDAIFWGQQEGVSCVQIPVNSGNLKEALPIVQKLQDLGCGVIGREPFSGGTLAEDTDSPGRLSLLKEVVNITGVDTILTGMTCRHHLQDNIDMMDKLMSDKAI